MEEQSFVHKSVLLYETVGSLNIKPGGIYVDGTLGGGGHAYEVCKRLGSGRLIGIDQDADAIEAAGRQPIRPAQPPDTPQSGTGIVYGPSICHHAYHCVSVYLIPLHQLPPFAVIHYGKNASY